MRFKKILAGVLAGALTISAITVNSLTINAAVVTSVPTGHEKVLYTADLTGKNSGTGKDKDFANVGIPISDASIMESENVYAKLVVSSYGTFTGEDGKETPAKDVLTYWGDLSGWLVGVKWYNNYSTPNGQFSVTFFPILVDNQFVSYVPISEFELDQYSQIGGNLQNGSFSSVEIESLQIVEFSELAPGEEVTLSSDIPIADLQKYESFNVTYKPQLVTECSQGEGGHKHGDNPPTYCTWAKVIVCAKAGSTWIQPGENDIIIAASSEDKESITVSIKSDKILPSLKKAENWTDEADTVCFSAWNATVTDVTGILKPTDVPVTVPVTGITLNETTLSLKKGETATLEATVAPDNATDATVTWSTSDPEVATVDETGKVTAVASGTATVTVTSNADETVKAECEVTVTNPATAITATASADSVLVGKTVTIAVTTTPADADKLTYTYATSDAKIATVDDKGVVTGVAAGEATITVTAKENEKLTASCKITVAAEEKPAESVTLDQTKLEIEAGKTAVLKATVAPEGCTDELTWTSSDTKVATVENGTVTAVAEGKATITAKAGEKSAVCEVTVTKKPVAITGITLDKTTATVEEEGTVQLTATVEPANTTEDKTVTWESSDKTIATVDNTGKVTGVKAGEATITATVGKFSAKCTVTVTAKPKEIIPGSSEGEAPVDSKDGLTIEVDDLDVALEAEPGTFEEGVTTVKAEVDVATDVPAAKEEAVEKAVKELVDSAEAAKVEISAVISITLKDQNGNEVQPVEGGVVTVTVPYDGKSNYAAYIEGSVHEFIKLTIDAAKQYASFNAKHFSDYYLVSLSDEAADAVDNAVSGEDTDTTHKGTLTMSDSAWWSKKELTVKDLIGNLNPDDVKSVTFTAVDHNFVLGYNTIDDWAQPDVKVGEPLVLKDILLKSIPAPTEENPDAMRDPAFKVFLSAGDGADYTITWIATTEETEEPGGDEPSGDTHKGSATLEATEYEGWFEKQITAEELVGSLDKTKAVITFSGDALSKVGYNSISEGGYKGIEGKAPIVVNASDVDFENYFFHVGGSAAAEITWVATVEGSGGDEPSGDTHKGSATLEATEYEGWFEKQITAEELVGSLDRTKAVITFSGDALSKVGYNSISEGGYKGIEGKAPIVVNASDVNFDDYFFHVGGGAAAEITWVATVGGSGGDTPGGDDNPGGDDTPDTPKFPTSSSGNFTDPGSSSSSGSSDTTTTTAAETPVPGDNNNNSSGNDNNTNAPSVTEENTATNTTSPDATKGEDNASGNIGNADQEPSGSAGNTSSGNVDDKNVATGLAFAFIPAAAAAAAVIISKKRK